MDPDYLGSPAVAGTIAEEGYSFFSRLMHPDDILIVLDSCIRAFEFMLEVPADQRKDFKTIFEFRLRNRCFHC